MTIKINTLSGLAAAIATLLLACNGTTEPKGVVLDTTTKQSKLSLSGMITFTEYEPIQDRFMGIVDLSLSKGDKKMLLSGSYAWRHPKGELIFNQGCGERRNRLAISDPLGRVKVVSPCSNTIENPGYLPSFFQMARLSPDQSLIAAQVRYYLDDGFRFSVVIYKNEEIIKVFDDFFSPEWLPDGRLLLASDGIYVTEVEGTPEKIDDGTLASGTYGLDVDPSGKRIAFEWNQQIWTIALDGSGLTELASGPTIYRFPTWSPDGKIIAFLAAEGLGFDRFQRAIHFVEVASGKYQAFGLNQLQSGHYPAGPLSWLEE